MTQSAEPCPVCGGHGVRYDRRVEVGRFGKLDLCPCIATRCRCNGQPPYQFWDEDSQRRWCPCHTGRRRLARVRNLFRDAQLPTRFRYKFREDFGFAAPDGSALQVARRVRPVLDYMTALVDDDRDPQRGYLFHGPPGTGKSLLACILLNEVLLRRTRSGRFISLSRFYHLLRDTYSSDSEHYGRTRQIMEGFCNLPFLVLDDVGGVEIETEFQKGMLYDLVDARYGEERFTIVTTNQSLQEMEELAGGRILSRLVEMCYVVDMEGQDYRAYLRS